MATMTAVVQEQYGAPEEVMRLAQIDRPAVGERDVLVRVRAAAVSGSDWHIYRGLPYAARFVTGLRRPRNRVPGLDVAGTVEAIGAQVRTLKPGDEVFGWCGGSFAEYVSVPAEQLLPKPANLTLEATAAVPVSGFTALQGVRRGQVRSGQQVLITGASGGVGTYAVQIAKAYGAEVTAVCSTAKVDLVRSIGADHVIDRTREEFGSQAGRFDVMLDIYGNPPLPVCRRVLKPGGVLVLIGGTGGRWLMGLDRWLRAMLQAPFLGRKVRPLIHQDRSEDLATLKDLIESGAVTPVLERTFPLAEAADAIRYVQEGRVRGQVVLVTGESPS